MRSERATGRGAGKGGEQGGRHSHGDHKGKAGKGQGGGSW